MQPMVGANVGHLDISQRRGDAACSSSLSSHAMLEFQYHFVSYKTWHFRLLLMALLWVLALLGFSR